MVTEVATLGPKTTIDFFETQLSLLKEELRELTLLGVEKAFKELNIKATEKCELIDYEMISKNTLSSYTKHYRGLFQFLALIGDYESLIMFHNQKSKDITQSMNANSVALYMLYKTWNSNQYLTDIDNRTSLVTDVLNNRPIQCLGHWNCKENADQFLSSITSLHESIGERGSYTDQCQFCLESIRADSNSRGCQFHLQQCRFYRKGNPRYHKSVKKAWKLVKELTSQHTRNKCIQITPMELERIRTFLFSSNSMADYQLYVMMLVAINLFLRFDEVSNMEYAHYTPEFSNITDDGHAHNLVFRVKGKSDVKEVYLVLWRQDEFPHFCPVRHLLFYLHIQKINGGYLFPDLIENKPKYSYRCFNDRVKHIMRKLLRRMENVSTHLFRNSGYLFAVFGRGCFDIIRKSARHKTAQTAIGYFQDALTIYESYKSDKANAEVVAKWKPTYLVSADNARSRHVDRFLQLHVLAKTFSDKVFGTTNPMNGLRNIPSLLNQVIEKPQEFSPVDEMKEVLQGLPLRQINEAISVLVRALQRVPTTINRTSNTPEQEEQSQSNLEIACQNNQRPQACQDNERPQLLLLDNISRENADLTTELVEINHSNDNRINRKRKTLDNGVARSKYRRKYGNIDIEERDKIKDLPPHGRLDMILDIYNKYHNVPKTELTSGARTFFYSVLTPIYACFTKHCNSDREEFKAKYCLSDYSRFGRDKCSGCGLVCELTAGGSRSRNKTK